MKRQLILALAGLSLLSAVASCGKQGDLDRPGPMWGPKARAEQAAQTRAEADAQTNATASKKTTHPQNPALQTYVDPAPIRDLPIPGEQTLPSASPAPGGGQQVRDTTGQAPQ